MNTQLELHPLSALFPRIEGIDFDALVEDIRANGLLSPITLLDGMILDGGNRYKACLAANVEATFTQYEGDRPAAFVWSMNGTRRHMGSGQSAVCVSLLQDWTNAQTRGGNGNNQHGDWPSDTKEETGKIAEFLSVADRATQSGASDRTQRMADKVAKQSPELAVKVAHGEITLPEAVEQITGKRPGAKPKVEKEVAEKPSEDSPKDEDQPDLLHDILELEKQNRNLAAVVKSLESSDQAREMMLLHERFLGLEGRLGQEITTRNAAVRQATYYEGILRKIASKLGVERFGDIMGALK